MSWIRNAWRWVQMHSARPLLWVLRGRKMPKGVLSWLSAQRHLLWMRSHRPLMEKLHQGGMSRRDVYVLMRMHQHSEQKGSPLTVEEWEGEEDRVNDLIDDITLEQEEEHGR